MTATTGEHAAKRSKGFTIESIIGKDSDRKTTEERKHRCDSPSETTTSSVHCKRVRDSEVPAAHERLRPADDGGGSGGVTRVTSDGVDGVHRAGLVYRDTRDFSFSNVRDGLFPTPQSESLKHFHEAFIQNSGSGGLGVGSFGPQRVCRYPLSPLNVPTGYPQPVPQSNQIHPMLLNNSRDIRQMYPFLADRYPGYFLPRYGVGNGGPGLFFQPYRKPKRIRTAFSPSQLLQLEKSFEKSHYVVGQERKDLAVELQLSETQVKVWFQNRRTKYKRMKSEEEGGVPQSHDSNSSTCQDSNNESDISDIDDVNDMDDDYHHDYHHPIPTC